MARAWHVTVSMVIRYLATLMGTYTKIVAVPEAMYLINSRLFMIILSGYNNYLLRFVESLKGM